MERKHYKKCLRQLVDAGITKSKLAKAPKEWGLGISVPTINDILKNNTEPTDRVKELICDGYDRIVSNFISLKD